MIQTSVKPNFFLTRKKFTTTPLSCPSFGYGFRDIGSNSHIKGDKSAKQSSSNGWLTLGKVRPAIIVPNSPPRMAASSTSASSTVLHRSRDNTSSLLSSKSVLHRSSSLSPLHSHNISPLIQFSPKGLANPLFVAPAEKKESSLQTEAVRQLTGSLTKAEGFRFAIVVARFNDIVTKPLLEGALDTFKKYSVKEEDIDVVWVPGSFEIPLVAQRLGKSGKYHSILCIGAVVRGDTTHYDAVANAAASGVLSSSLNSGVPCVFGVLTCEDMDQALNRAGGKAGNKGSEAALTAIEMASLFEHHLKD